MWPSGKAPGFGPGIPRFESWHLRRHYKQGDRSIADIAAIVLAGGKGVRMKSDLPKVLHPLRGKPLVSHVIRSLRQAGIQRITVVVGYRGELVVDAVSDDARTVWQREQLGTGHAVMQAEEDFAGFSGLVLVACGDVPLVRPETFRELAKLGSAEGVKAVVLTMKPASPTGYGRIVRDGDGSFVKIVEEKDASHAEKAIGEVNSGTYAFDCGYLFEGLKRIDTNNAQREYYLPDVLQHIRQSGFRVETLVLEDAIEGSGVNTPEELAVLDEYARRRESDRS